ncbi:MAG: flavin-containing monooxygenase [Pseudomonadota bacterium]
MDKPVSVLIVGAGFAGLGAAIRLLENGIDDIVILERAGRAGGTWRDNTYPGAACDIPSNLYSFSFAPNPHWSRGYSGSGEILGYIDNLVERWRLNRFIRYGQNVNGLAFDEAQGMWQVTTDAGIRRARTVIMASGPLSNFSFPDMPGIDTYEGHRIHSARWDHDYDFRGKRVAVIGTGASAVQIVPELVKQAARLKVFQRTPGWVLPRFDYATADWNRSLFGRFPGAQQAVRDALYWGHETMALGVVWTTPVTRVIEQAARLYLRRTVQDPWLRRQLTPDFRIGCKRILMTSDWYPALQQPNCELVTWPIATLSPKGIRTAEGIEHAVDCIVFATGFDVAKAGTPFPVSGLGGRSLGAEWARGVQAYKSVSVSGYPNLFLTCGPNSGPGHNSLLVYLEAQLEYIVQGVRHVLQGPVKYLDVDPGRQQSFNATIQRRLRGTNWNTGCRSWYLTEDGFNPTMYPGFATQFRRQMRVFEPADYNAAPAG